MPACEAAFMARLGALGMAVETHRHPPLHTVAESKALRGALAGGHIKNLFLRDKRRSLWLVTVDEDRAVDLKALRRLLGARGNLSFASPELLRDALGVEPGAVTPFAVMNDTAGRVTLVIDRAVLDNAVVNAHPLHNAATTAIASDALVAFASACGHAPLVIDFQAGAVLRALARRRRFADLAFAGLFRSIEVAEPCRHLVSCNRKSA